MSVARMKTPMTVLHHYHVNDGDGSSWSLKVEDRAVLEKQGACLCGALGALMASLLHPGVTWHTFTPCPSASWWTAGCFERSCVFLTGWQQDAGLAIMPKGVAQCQPSLALGVEGNERAGGDAVGSGS